jgi:Transferrin
MRGHRPNKDAQYYAVAVVKAEMCASEDDFGLADLRNLTSCHTGEH